MADYIIATSSTSDLPRTWLDAHKIPFIPYTYTVGDKLFEDDCREESRDAVYAGMRKGDRLKTSMINEFVYYDFFKSLLETGKDVIFLDMSQKMSVSFVNANKAAEEIRAGVPGAEALCDGHPLHLRRPGPAGGAHGGAHGGRGMSFDEVIAWGEENKLKIAHRFTVDDLNYLKAGGRVSNAAALVGSMLSIKPVLYVPDRGTLDVAKKVRGRKAALKAILDGVLHDLSQVDPTGRKIHILQADCRADAEIRARRHQGRLSPGGRDHHHGPGRGHRRPLRPRPADGLLPLQRPHAAVRQGDSSKAGVGDPTPAFSALHLFSQKQRYGLGQLVLHLGARDAAPRRHEQHAAHHVALRQDRGRHRQAKALVLRGHGHAAAAALMTIGPPPLHDLVELGAERLVQQLPPGAARDGDDRVPVADGGDAVGGLAQAVADLRGKIRQLPDGGILFKDQLPVLVGEDLQRVTLADAHGAADLLGDHHPAQVVCSCQVFAKKILRCR